MRVLILDFDFFSATGGGQTFYRRVVERHPEIEFCYPSRGQDLRSPVKDRLPQSAHPFAFDAFADIGSRPTVRPLNDYDADYALRLARIAMAVQGYVFDAVEVPSYFPVAHLVRPIFASYGIQVRCVSLGLLGWVSVGVRNGYSEDGGNQVADYLQACEARSVEASDILYTISELHADENKGYGRPSVILDIHDTFEEFALPSPVAPGSGPPNLWYVGRLDRNKGPDLFLEIVARVPRHLFRDCCLTGPDNLAWTTGATWSDALKARIRELGLDVVYTGHLSDKELRKNVYAGRSVLVVPSRADAFNFVALEALANGCPILLSRHTGAAGFLRKHHKNILPPIIEPENIEQSAAQLTTVLDKFEDQSARLRKQLIKKPLPKPRNGFMLPIFCPDKIAPVAPRANRIHVPALFPLLSPVAATWRPKPQNKQGPHVISAVVIVRDKPAHLAATLASLSRQVQVELDILVIDDGSIDPSAIQGVVRSFDLTTKLVRQGAQGFYWAANHAAEASRGSITGFFDAGDIFDLDLLHRGIETIKADSPAVAFLPNWAPSWAADGLILGTITPGEYPLEQYRRLLGPGLMVNREVLLEAGGFDVSLGRWAQVDLILRLSTLGRVAHQSDSRVLAWCASPLTPPGVDDEALFARMLQKNQKGQSATSDRLAGAECKMTPTKRLIGETV